MNDPAPIRSSWNESKLIIGKRLTDKTIERYKTLGYYSEDFRAYRRARMAKKMKPKREGNFLIVDGRAIFNPI